MKKRKVRHEPPWRVNQTHHLQHSHHHPYFVASSSQHFNKQTIWVRSNDRFNSSAHLFKQRIPQEPASSLHHWVKQNKTSRKNALNTSGLQRLLLPQVRNLHSNMQRQRSKIYTDQKWKTGMTRNLWSIHRGWDLEVEKRFITERSSSTTRIRSS